MPDRRDGEKLEPAEIREITITSTGGGEAEEIAVKVRIDHDLGPTGRNDPSTHVVEFDVDGATAVFEKATRRSSGLSGEDREEEFIAYRTLPAIVAAEEAVITRVGFVEKVIGIASRTGAFAENVELAEVDDEAA